MTASKIDDREPAETKSDRAADVVALIIRTAMDKSSGHRFEFPAFDWFPALEIKSSADTAH
jgi:mannose/cellobiose epimerase-like protein (N-acyl-D-glucosamine 2-epimerase family)